MSSQPFEATLRQQLRLDQRLRSLLSLGWPTLAGILLALAGLLLMAVSYQLKAKQHELQRRSLQAERANGPPDSNYTRPLPAVLPSPSDYTADLAKIFDIGKSQGIVLSGGDYRDGDRMAIPVDIRVLDLRFNESYTKLKEFLAAILNTMPHAAVQEVRIERKDSVTTRHQVVLKLALVYAAAEAKPATLPQPASQLLGTSPGAGKGSLQP